MKIFAYQDVKPTNKVHQCMLIAYVVSMTRQADTFSVNILKRDRKLLSKHENKFKTDEEERRKTKGVTTKQKGIAELFQ